MARAWLSGMTDNLTSMAFRKYSREVKHLNQIYEWRLAAAWILYGTWLARQKGVMRFPWEPAIGPVEP